MNPRIRRLQADYQRVFSLFSNHPFIVLLKAEGKPPEKYTFEFRIPGIIEKENESLVVGKRHRAEVYLPADYPRRPPFCRMITPVYHPNIDPQKICIGDHWSAGQSLAHLIIRIAEMLCFQSYNVKSPLNAKAAAWAEQNVAKLPLVKKDLTGGL
ncbi:ubiquitin-conjugating enzyme E2 [Acidobacteriota bacterium]